METSEMGRVLPGEPTDADASMDATATDNFVTAAVPHSANP